MAAEGIANSAGRIKVAGIGKSYQQYGQSQLPRKLHKKGLSIIC